MMFTLCVALTWWMGLTSISSRQTGLAIALAWPSTVLHELAHFVVALITGSRPSSFSVWPQRVDGGWQLGSVAFAPCFWRAGLVALAPLLWFAIGAALLWKAPLLATTVLEQLELGWLAGVMLAAGSPSKTDWGISLRYPGALLVAAALAGAAWTINRPETFLMAP